MKHHLKRVYFAILLAAFIFSFSFLKAETFNPNFVISDSDMQDYDSMNKAEIQIFLENKDSFLSDYTAEDVHGKKRRASEIIYNAAREYKINPKYILVMLQKEQSVITDKDPSERQLDYAAGYAVCDSCSFTDEKVIKYKGFGKQVDAAAGIMRWYYENVKTQAWIKQPYGTYAIDGTPVNPANYATGFMYTYTPHLEGNKNFWKIWQQWFKQVYPDGSLLKALDNPDVYLIQDGKKRQIKSMSALMSRFDPKNIIQVPASELDRYETGAPLAFANYSILKEGTTYYLVDFDVIRPFKSKQVFQSFGYNPDEVIEVDEDDFESYELGDPITSQEEAPLGRIILIGKQLYFVKSDTYAPLYDQAIARTRFPQLVIEKGTAEDLAGLDKVDPLTFPDATLIGDKQTGKIYVVENGKRKHITSEVVFNGLGYNWGNVIWVEQFVVDVHTLGEPIYLDIESDEAATPTPAPSKPTTPTTTPTKPSASTKVPINIEENGKVMLTPTEKTTYTGSKTFTTKQDVYLITDEAGKILAGKNIDVIRPVASLTKIMTAYRLFDEDINLEKSTTYKAAKHSTPYDAYRITEGEAVKNRDLMKAMLITSRNPPARMLASSVESDEADFITRMNEQAKSWGLTQTYFADVHGYDLKNQSTAREFLTIFQKSLQNKTIKADLGTNYFEYDETFDLDNKPFHAGTHTNTLTPRTDLEFTIVASKTGFLNESGYNLAMLASRKTDGKKFYILMMGEPTYSQRNEEMIKLTNWALQTF